MVSRWVHGQSFRSLGARKEKPPAFRPPEFSGPEIHEDYQLQVGPQFYPPDDASAGGLDAFNKFFDHMPADWGMAFVMILHLPADRKSMLAEILGRWTPMRVLAGEDGVLIAPNCV